MNLYAFVLNDPLMNVDLYGLYTTPQWLKNSAGGTLHGAAHFGVQNINFLTDVGFAMSSPFLYSYRKMTGGSFANDYQVHLQQKANLSVDTQNFIQRIFPVDQESNSFITSRNTTNSVLNGAAIGSSVAGLYYGGRALASRTLDFCNKSSQFLKRLNSYPKINQSTGLSLNNKAYSGMDVEKILKDVKINIGNTFNKKNPLKGTFYSEKVLNQMRPNLKTGLTEYHGFPQLVDNYAKYGKIKKIIGRDGVPRTEITLKGSFRGNEGIFKWIVESDYSINHRIFKHKK